MTQLCNMRPDRSSQGSQEFSALAAWRRLWILLLAEPEDLASNGTPSPGGQSAAESIGNNSGSAK